MDSTRGRACNFIVGKILILAKIATNVLRGSNGNGSVHLLSLL